MKDTLTLVEAYRAMRSFVEAYWVRGGKKGDELTLFIHYAGAGYPPTAENPVGSNDPAAWNDWLASVRAATTD
jgi:hypothetical protein